MLPPYATDYFDYAMFAAIFRYYCRRRQPLRRLPPRLIFRYFADAIDCHAVIFIDCFEIAAMLTTFRHALIAFMRPAAYAASRLRRFSRLSLMLPLIFISPLFITLAAMFDISPAMPLMLDTLMLPLPYAYATPRFDADTRRAIDLSFTLRHAATTP